MNTVKLEEKKKLPIGIDTFDKIIRQNFYYVDKTEMIAELLQNWGEVNLITRPRRFGKSLNMSMLKSFFEIGNDTTLFDGLKISENKELCEKYMGQFPVISISLKGVEGLNYQEACANLKKVIGTEALRFHFLKNSPALTEEEQQLYKQLIEVGNAQTGMFVMGIDLLTSSLQILSALLFKHYGKQAILLIDEYDVPLDKAFQYHYYDEMVFLIRSMFGNALKTNPSLYFAVQTGCLRVAKESIFTGLNNFTVLSVLNAQFDEYFGFTDEEVREILTYYGVSEKYDTVKEWYDGYLFGKKSVYCPWDVLSYCKTLCTDLTAFPEDYWSNTSGNAIVRRFIDKANRQTRNEIEQLIAGEEIVNEIRQELTYNELDTTIENLWSVLFTTGYLTQRGRADGKKYRLVIPNMEIRELFVTQIREWFKETVSRDRETLDAFYKAFLRKNTDKIEQIFGDYLWNTISIRDTAVAKERKENFYHGILLGLFAYMDDWVIKSNAESGIGYSDILIEDQKNRIGIVIEVKYADNGDMQAACMDAVQQIERKRYDAKLKADGMRTIIRYRIACYQKECHVILDD